MCPEYDTFSNEALTRLCRGYGVNLRNRKKMIRKLEDIWGFYHLEGMEDQVPQFNPYPGKGKPTVVKPSLHELASRSCSSREHEEASRRLHSSGGGVGHRTERTPLPSTRDPKHPVDDRTLQPDLQIPNKKGIVRNTVDHLEAAIAQLQSAKQHAEKQKVYVIYVPLLL